MLLDHFMFALIRSQAIEKYKFDIGRQVTPTWLTNNTALISIRGEEIIDYYDDNDICLSPFTWRIES